MQAVARCEPDGWTERTGAGRRSPGLRCHATASSRHRAARTRRRSVGLVKVSLPAFPVKKPLGRDRGKARAPTQRSGQTKVCRKRPPQADWPRALPDIGQERRFFGESRRQRQTTHTDRVTRHWHNKAITSRRAWLFHASAWRTQACRPATSGRPSPSSRRRRTTSPPTRAPEDSARAN